VVPQQGSRILAHFVTVHAIDDYIAAARQQLRPGFRLFGITAQHMIVPQPVYAGAAYVDH
jgi:hypothetical protein